MLRDLQNQLQLRQLANSHSPPIPSFITLNNLPINPWMPSKKFSNLLTVFNSTILNQFICAACAFCGQCER